MKAVNVLGAVAGAGIMVAAVAGCGPKSHAADAQAKAELATPQAKQVQAQVERCINTGGGHKAVIDCIVPPKNKAVFESCALKAVAADFANKVALKNDLTLCVVNDR